MRLRDLDLNLLVALEALLRESHVSRAAARLEISQSSMSLALSKLRTVFDDPLLVKGSNALVLTAKAQELLPRLEGALQQIDNLLNEMESFDPSKARETITLILTDYIDYTLSPALMKVIAEQAPGITLRVVDPNPKRLGELFSAGDVDVSATYFPNPPVSLRTRPLFSDRLVGIARCNHPFLKQPNDLKAFCDFQHITVEPGEATMYNALLDFKLKQLGMSRRVALQKPTFLGVPFIVQQTDLLATLPATVAYRFASFTNIEVFEPPLELEPLNVMLLWHDRTHTNPLHRWFRDQVIALCAQPLTESTRFS